MGLQLLKKILWKHRVKKELLLWTDHVLSKPSSFFNGLPSCPFAKKALRDKSVRITFGKPSEINKYMAIWNESHQLHIHIIKEKVYFNTLSWVCKIENARYKTKDLVAMEFVPGNGIESGQPDGELHDWPHLIDEEYAMVFIQRLSDLKEASEMLDNKGYYDNCTSQFKKYVSERNENAR